MKLNTFIYLISWAFISEVQTERRQSLLFKVNVDDWIVLNESSSGESIPIDDLLFLLWEMVPSRSVAELRFKPEVRDLELGFKWEAGAELRFELANSCSISFAL